MITSRISPIIKLLRFFGQEAIHLKSKQKYEKGKHNMHRLSIVFYDFEMEIKSTKIKCIMTTRSDQL